MSTHHRPLRTAGAGLLAAIALLTTACNDPSSSNPASTGSSALFHRTGGGSSSGAAGFVVLANAAVTCTAANITGDVGTFQTAPPGAITQTEGCVISGATDVGGPAAVAAYNAFLGIYAGLAPQLGDNCPVISGTLAGQTLSAGVYCVSAEAKTGVLTLSGNSSATWLIKVPAGALTGTNFQVVLAGGAQACNVTWWVDAAATMTTSAFQGNILAGAGITFTGGTQNGNIWAGADGVGDVTFTGTAVTGCGSSGSQICKVSRDKVTGGGWISLSSGAKGTFGVSGGIRRGAFWGHLEFNDHGRNGPTVKSVDVTAYSVIDDVTRRIEGTAKIDGRRGFTYRVEVSDNGEPGRNDTFRLWLSNGYSASGSLSGGNIQLHKPHGRACDKDGHDGNGHDDGDDDDDGDHDDGHGH
jgi:hypothetical protein